LAHLPIKRGPRPFIEKLKHAVWGRWINRANGDGRLEPFPRDCANCGPDWQKYFGCGFAGYEGKGKQVYTKGSRQEPYSRTCPRYYYQQPWVSCLLSDLGDYKRGAMGNVLYLEAQYLDYLRILENEMTEWEGENIYKRDNNG
jgi:hypothetical protein